MFSVKWCSNLIHLPPTFGFLHWIQSENVLSLTHNPEADRTWCVLKMYFELREVWDGVKIRLIQAPGRWILQSKMFDGFEFRLHWVWGKIKSPTQHSPLCIVLLWENNQWQHGVIKWSDYYHPEVHIFLYNIMSWRFFFFLSLFSVMLFTSW